MSRWLLSDEEIQMKNIPDDKLPVSAIDFDEFGRVVIEDDKLLEAISGGLSGQDQALLDVNCGCGPGGNCSCKPN
jgi:hypothetical protein